MSQAWSGFCMASDINKLDQFLTRCKKTQLLRQAIPIITEQFDNAEQSLL